MSYIFTSYHIPVKEKLIPDPTDPTIPFYVEDVSGLGGTITIPAYSSLEYSTDNVTWSSTKPLIPANGRVYIRANVAQWGSENIGTRVISVDNRHIIGGNILSLQYGSSFTGSETTLLGTARQFGHMFASDTSLYSAASLILPSKTIGFCSYFGMFSGCTSLVSAPEVPATIFTDLAHSLQRMFYGCTSLVNPPTVIPALEAPATYAVHESMFEGCTSLTHTPIIKASPNYSYGFYNMFRGCSSLNTIIVESTTWDAVTWVEGVAATGTFYKPTNTNIPTGTNGIPSGWTVVNV